jgi:hypothetical protein
MAGVDVGVSGGNKLQSYLEELAGNLAKGGELKVGFLEGSTYPDGTTSVPYVAAIQEFGSPAENIPPRPYFRNMIAENAPMWGDDIAKVLKATNYDGNQTLSLMGERINGQLQDSIRNTNDPRNAASTIAKKGFDNPLIDSGHLLSSSSYEVKS